MTAVRTAAVSAIATDSLALPDASILAILGSGIQARSHLEAMLAVRPVTEVRVWSRTPENARGFADEQSALHGLPVQVAPDVAKAVEGADVICTTTGARLRRLNHHLLDLHGVNRTCLPVLLRSEFIS